MLYMFNQSKYTDTFTFNFWFYHITNHVIDVTHVDPIKIHRYIHI